MCKINTDTICAIATPPGRGGIGIVRVSGVQAFSIAKTISKKELPIRKASFAAFHDAQDQVIDEGLLIAFAAPHSFTGENVVELQGHGGPVVMDMLLNRCVQLGARIARPGEFSERAFLNDKIDLTQAEAIADLIDSQTQTAARLAVRSLQGEFSQRIQGLLEALIQLRSYVEAAIDFPEEEIDFLSDGRIQKDLNTIIQRLVKLQQNAQHGRVIREGMTLVIAGRPNAGKSSLLNALVGEDSAIVTDIPGTTRDVLREHIQIDGMPVHIMDTAGLRDSQDQVEQLGIQKAKQEIEKADRVLWIYDGSQGDDGADLEEIPKHIPVTYIYNKADLSGQPIGYLADETQITLVISAKQGLGIDLLKQHLKQSMGVSEQNEGQFMARRRHLEALEKAAQQLQQGQQALDNHLAGELLAEDLRLCQQTLSEITGEFSADDLLGEIFSSFCIGK